MLAKQGVSEVLLVTSALHMPRSMNEFALAAKEQGLSKQLQITAAPCGHWSDPPLIWRSWIPALSSAYRLHQVVHEWVGLWAATGRIQ
jgi:uncharacterized SAM-binding protein YcdF (DUF218 family)